MSAQKRKKSRFFKLILKYCGDRYCLWCYKKDYNAKRFPVKRKH